MHMYKLYTNKDFESAFTKDKMRFYKAAKKFGKNYTLKQIDDFWLKNPYLAQHSQAPRRRYKKKVRYTVIQIAIHLINIYTLIF